MKPSEDDLAGVTEAILADASLNTSWIYEIRSPSTSETKETGYFSRRFERTMTHVKKFPGRPQ